MKTEAINQSLGGREFGGDGSCTQSPGDQTQMQGIGDAGDDIDGRFGVDEKGLDFVACGEPDGRSMRKCSVLMASTTRSSSRWTSAPSGRPRDPTTLPINA